MPSLNLSSNAFISKHLQFIKHFLPIDNEDIDTLNIKIGFALTCLYMWIIQTIYCGIIGLYNISIICFSSGLIYLSLMYFLKFKVISNITFSRFITLINILNLHLCYLNAGAYINPTVVWLMAIPVVSIILTGLKEGIFWSFISSMTTIGLMEAYRHFNWSFNDWSTQHTYEVGQSNMFTGPLLFYIMFGFFYFSRDKLQKKIQNQSEKIKEVAFEKEKLLNVIFHDLGRNTSLLSGYLELTEQGTLSKEALVKLYRHTEEIKNILKNAKNLDTHNIVKELTDVNLYDVWLSLKEIYDSKLSQKKLEFMFQGSKTTSCLARRTHLQSHILSNLISNAIKFSFPNNEIIFNVEDNRVLIINTGIPFTETQKLGTSDEKGNGLGLEIVKDFCHKNNYIFSINTVNDQTTAMVSLS